MQPENPLKREVLFTCSEPAVHTDWLLILMRVRIWSLRAIESASIFDLSGKRVMESRPNTSDVILNTRQLNRGVYILNVVSGGERVTRKVVL
jgi:hypothetical protein